MVNVLKNGIFYILTSNRSVYMSTFVSNFNEFLTTMQIKQNYISHKSGIDENKLSRILTGKQSPTEKDLESLSKAAGKTILFFLNPDFKLSTNYSAPSGRIAFYAGNPTKEQTDVADNLLELMENVDVILSARDSFINMVN